MLALLIPGVGMGGGQGVIAPARVRIRLRGRRDTTIPLHGRRDTSLHLRGNEDMAVRSDYESYRGEDLTVLVTVDDDGTGFSVSGWTCQMKVAASEGGAAILTKTASVVGDGSARQLTATFARADTLALTPRTYYWEVRRTDTNANTVLACGRWDLLLERAV